MQIKDFIKKKQDSKSHTEEEINYFIKNLDSFSQDEITQWLKAVKANSLNDKETSLLTIAMAKSGTMLTWEGLEPVLDKHSTGGIGDKVTLLFVPLISAYGINIPKLSGRSLGITGGTIDKLESISGFRTNLSIKEIKEQVKKIGLAIASTSSDLAPADKKLYAIRDVTNTVDSIPLIASSVMSKKIACGASNIILDVKCGSGAFMKTIENARELGAKMVAIGKNSNKNIKAIITNMNQPLGYAIGNSLEIKEVLEVLKGKTISDLVELVICLGREAVLLVENEPAAKGEPRQGREKGRNGESEKRRKGDEKDLEDKLKELLLGGKAYKKFEEMVLAQGGNLKSDLKKAEHIEIIRSEFEGYIHNIDAHIIGEVVHDLGAHRKHASDQIDHSVGIVLCKKYGEKVKVGNPILEIHAKSTEDAKNAKSKLTSAIKLGQNEPSKLKLIHEVIN